MYPTRRSRFEQKFEDFIGRLETSARAFTLIELLVVSAIIAIFAGMLLPTLVSAKERARRVSCKSSQHQFLLAVHMYGDDNNQMLPSGAPNPPKAPNDDHLPVLSDATSNSIVRYLGTRQLVHCPSVGDYFIKRQLLRPLDEQAYGYVVGYNYHGSHTNTPWPAIFGTNTWISPQKLTDNNTLVLISDVNDWSPGYGQSFAPHGKTGPILQGLDASNPTANGSTSAAIGASGGNIGLLDGSVSWKKINNMQIYRGSQQWDNMGCWAMW
jgi:prepilin-type N-terminal cleavage/methylation domain-containing protein